ncbi:hypothetical protein BCR34DRAFT_608021 [Clohesyomyces aquaticus]|uniref:BZIP domain-containing protein n=1 Tax=Clohesyomyces aquaticus TaxID=1231657 RepID=A0A1Y1YBC1_9PLEO|nr:hypothetical protein BCR34DRAFT_608021 [Clohesyomyces aquaticus]
MEAPNPIISIALQPTEQLKEAKGPTDDWTGKTDAKERRKLQNRLHQRAWRRRKAAQHIATSASWESTRSDHAQPSAFDNVEEAFARAVSAFIPADIFSQPGTLSRPKSPYTAVPSSIPPRDLLPSIHDLMSINLITNATPLPTLDKPEDHNKLPLLIPPVIAYLLPGISIAEIPPFRFPLSPDHYLITLIQYNVLRATVTLHAVVHIMHTIPPECRAALNMSLLPYPTTLPVSLHPTPLQASTPHRPWIDTVPCARLRDNLILSTGKWDEDDLCEDMVGGLYDGYDDCRQRGWLVWSDPWVAASWEMSEGFVAKWGWLLEGCRELVESTNRWREGRGEDALVVEV